MGRDEYKPMCAISAKVIENKLGNNAFALTARPLPILLSPGCRYVSLRSALGYALLPPLGALRDEIGKQRDGVT